MIECQIDVLLSNPENHFELVDFYFKLLKFRLSMNDCKFKGFILVNKFEFASMVNYEELFYENEMSKERVEKVLRKEKKNYDKK